MTPEQLDCIRAIAEKYGYGWNKAHAEKVGFLTQRLIYQLFKQNLIAVQPTYMLISLAVALPHDIGRNPNAIGKGEHNRRSFETLKKELEGVPLDQDEATIIQYSALFHTGKDWMHLTVPGKPELDTLVKTWAGVLRIADGLDYGLTQQVSDVTLTTQGKQIFCKVAATGHYATEVMRANGKSDLLKALGLNITVS